MKALLLLISIIFYCTIANAQHIYYGGSIGVVSGKYYSPKKGIEKKGVYDAYLHGLIGYANGIGLIETNFGATASLIPSVDIAGGIRGNLSDNVGIHLVAGYRDEMAIQTKTFSITHYFYPTARLRLWVGTFMVQGTFIKKKENSELEFGIGVIGF